MNGKEKVEIAEEDCTVTYITVRLKATTRERMLTFGKMQDSYDDVINRALDSLEREQKAEQKSKK